MEIDIIQGLIGGIAAILVWFIIGVVVFMNPFVRKIYKKYKDDNSVKNRKDVKSFITITFVFALIL